MRYLIYTLLGLSQLPNILAAETHNIRAIRYYNSFDHRNAVLARIKPGDTVNTKTLDAAGYDDTGKKVGDTGNPLTGPFYIEGAEAGDAIAITFDRMRLNRNYGYTRTRLGLYAINPETVEGIYPGSFKMGSVIPGRDDVFRWELDLKANRAHLTDRVSKVHKMEFATSPMLGCVGVAAPGVFGPNSGISGAYGGNMDYNRVAEGATVVLPVYHPGALLFMGDGHALQADGEPTGTGIETSMDVTFHVELRKQARVSNPRIETSQWVIAIGSQPEFASSLDRALRVATSEMIDWLTRDFKMEPWAAHMLIGYQGRYDVITVAGSMGLRIPRSALPPGNR